MGACARDVRGAWPKRRLSAGETLVETLVSVLVSGLSLAMLAMAISSSGRLVAQGNAKLDGYYAQNNELVSAFAGDAGGTPAEVRLKVGGEVLLRRDVRLFGNDEAVACDVLAYRVERQP